METSSKPAAQPLPSIHDLKWSPTEKSIAHKAFDKALGQELEEVVRSAKERVSRVQEADGLWELERWLAERRSEIDRKYDYRYSILPFVFAGLVREGRLTEGDLSGLAPDKLAFILGLARW